MAEEVDGVRFEPIKAVKVYQVHGTELTRSERRMVEIERQNLCLQPITIKDDDLARCFGGAMCSFCDSEKYLSVRRNYY